MMNLVYLNEQRLTWNSVMYETSHVPERQPGGGGFSVIQLTLDNLFDSHEKCYNWWTQSNENYPLCKYLGCKIKCYQSENVDYVIKYQTSGPYKSNKLTYPSCQPSMLLMSSNKKIIPSTKTQKLRKPYKIIRVPPPPQLETKWYFTQDLAKQPLIILYTAATSLQHYYTGTNWDSNNISITYLNTTLINNRHFTKRDEPWPYKDLGTVRQYFWYYRGLQHPANSEDLELKHLVPLQNIKDFVAGQSYEEYNPHGTPNKVNDYATHIMQLLGNPLLNEYTTTPENFYISNYSAREFVNAWKTNSTATKLSQLSLGSTQMHMTRLQEPIVKTGRYNPLTDKGETTQMYLLSNNKPEKGWDPPNDDTLRLDGFPLWLNIWGFVDFQKRLQKLNNVDTEYMLVFKTRETFPRENNPIVPLDYNFLHDRSPYDSGQRPLPYDETKWYPQIQFQTQSINTIAICGPGTPKLQPRMSEEIKIKYQFDFKWGGAPAKMVTVENPTSQAVYPMPRNEYETPSLQGPTQAFETVLYTFDQRNYQLTKSAIERISKDWTLTNLLSSITEPTKEVPTDQAFQTLLQEAQTEEEKEASLQSQLNQHRQQQRELKLRILKLIQQQNM